MRIRLLQGLLLLLCSVLYSTHQEEKRYAQLLITPSQQEDVRALITTLADTSQMALMFKKSELEAIGRRVDGLHPLRYIGFIYGELDLKCRMSKLLKKAIVAKRFVSELSVGLDSKLAQGELLPYVPGFADSLALREADIAHYFSEKDWKGLLGYLTSH